MIKKAKGDSEEGEQPTQTQGQPHYSELREFLQFAPPRSKPSEGKPEDSRPQPIDRRTFNGFLPRQEYSSKLFEGRAATKQIITSPSSRPFPKSFLNGSLSPRRYEVASYLYPTRIRQPQPESRLIKNYYQLIGK